MGQRSQIYIRYNVENNKGLIARYYQWNYKEQMVSRARGIIEEIKDEFVTHSSAWFNKYYLEKLSRICDVNFDMRDVAVSLDIIEEVADKLDCDCSYIFSQDNNDGQLLIDVTDNGIKYCFIPYWNEIKPMDCKQYLIWDSRNFYEQCRWTETKVPVGITEEEKEYTLDNIEYIMENATLMTEKEAKEFVGADYSYLFAPKF